ncbi:MAG TPA: acyloxyacyl hydrolase [Silvibacterium sp.]|nr:acyloxyacyl hydrolase [Silvibacterium sp.]
MRMKTFCLLTAALWTFTLQTPAQTTQTVKVQAVSVHDDAPAREALADHPWEFGPFFQGGVGTGDRSGFTFLSAGARGGKVLTTPHLPGVLRGQFEYAVEVMPYWQSFTPPPHDALTEYEFEGEIGHVVLPYGGGTFTGFSITPIILRWNFSSGRRFVPWVQGAGGLIYTTHKYPPDILVPPGQPGGTSVWNFSPQFGIGFHYFVKPRRSINFAANAIHISSASLGDRNPGVNASVQFQIGYTWWK